MVGATDVGRKRKANQDSLYYDSKAGIGIVADGIGGRKGGEIASSIVVDGLRKTFMNSDLSNDAEINSLLMTAVDEVNQQILNEGELKPEIKGMGSTLNCLMFIKNKLHIAHIGDSRTYLYYQRHFWQLTLDHNVKTFLSKGWLDRSKVLSNSSGSALVRAMGLFDELEVDVYEKTVKPGEIYLTSSDGLFDMVSDAMIVKIMNQNLNNFEELPNILIREANKNGGKDNITVLLSKVLEI